MRRIVLTIVGLLAAASLTHAQLRGVKADLTPVVEHAAAHPGETVRLALQVRLPAGFHVQSNAPRDPSLIPTVLTVTPPGDAHVAEIVYPPATDLKQAGVPQPLAVFPQEFVLGASVALPPGAAAGALTIPGRLRYQACNDTMCFAPVTADVSWALRVAPESTATDRERNPLFDGIAFGTGQMAPRAAAPDGQAKTAAEGGTQNPRTLADQLDRFVLAGSTGGYLGRDDFLAFVRDAEQGVTRRGWFEGRGPIGILLLVLAGGIALNLTPCVLPMIPINLAIIGAGAAAASRARGFWLGAAYGGAMAIVYGVLGLVVVLTASTFGTINASPWFNLAIAVLFVVLALAMFDVILIDFSRFSSRFNPAAGKGSFVLAFSMGAVAALLAGACVAPVVIQVVLFSSNLYAAGTTIALGLPFILGVGMALPWPVAGAGLASLPAPGAWMVRVKQVFGVVILATAVYYGYEAYSLFSNRWVDRAEVASSVEQLVEAGWYRSPAEGLAAAERDGKPVLIDFWATWCKNCLTMDKTTLADADVRAALDGYVKIKFQAEDPEAEPAKSVLGRFRAVGLPTYVILHPKAVGTD
jgi:cytochrome c biogenesis protein CcdA/DsbC/DsbD-like thiol-disulfide interchange protein